MDSTPRDTIAAVATAAGAAAIAVVRISGPDALSIAKTLTGKTLTPRHAEYCSFRNARGEIIDRGIALSFPAPHSFNGEDVVEFQGHGGPVVVDWLLAEIHRLGARPAEAGEFSLRAFLNDKLDLTQAEAIADLIASSSRAQAKAADRLAQQGHEECGPFYFGIELGEDRVSFELLIRSESNLHCSCISYASRAQRDFLLKFVDKMLTEEKIRA